MNPGINGLNSAGIHPGIIRDDETYAHAMVRAANIRQSRPIEIRIGRDGGRSPVPRFYEPGQLLPIAAQPDRVEHSGSSDSLHEESDHGPVDLLKVGAGIAAHGAVTAAVHVLRGLKWIAHLRPPSTPPNSYDSNEHILAASGHDHTDPPIPQEMHGHPNAGDTSEHDDAEPLPKAHEEPVATIPLSTHELELHTAHTERTQLRESLAQETEWDWEPVLSYDAKEPLEETGAESPSAHASHEGASRFHALQSAALSRSLLMRGPHASPSSSASTSTIA